MPQSIGSYSSFTAKSSTVLHKYNETDGHEYNDNNLLYWYHFSNSFTLGNIKQGQTITFAPISRNFYVRDENNDYQLVEINGNDIYNNGYTLTIYENGASMATATLNENATYNYTAQGGTITINTVDDVAISKTVIDSNSQNPYKDLVVPIERIHATITVPNDAFMLIGYDGLAVNFGTSATAYIGTSETTIKYGNYGVKVSANGLQQYNGTSWVGINNRRNVKTITANYTLTNDDDLIIYNSATQRTLTLPSTLEVGKTVYIKRLGSTTLKIQSSGTNIYLPNATTAVNNTTLTNYTCLTWDGTHWLVGYLYS